MKKNQKLKSRWYVNTIDENGVVVPILVKDTNGIINPEHRELVEKIGRSININFVKIFAKAKGYDIDVE